jgi:probable HAF family extracellular repeat protein
MKSSTLAYLTAVAVLAVLAAPILGAAQSRQRHNQGRTRYTVVNLGTLGGTIEEANGISNRGWVAGYSTLQGDQTAHATLWTKETGLQDLGTLGGPSSEVTWPVKDDRGLIAGLSDTSDTDPFNESFCGLSPSGIDPYICRAFLWQNGVMTALPTLGGYNSVATTVNNRGQVVGWAENNTQDPNCIAPQVFDWEAFIWDMNDGKIHELPPLPGDVVAAATGINDNGQVVGASSPICANAGVADSISARIVLWQNGSVVDLGSLGGVQNNLAFAINNRGEVVGQADIAGDTTYHAFLWTKGKGMQDIGTLPGDVVSVALGLNNKGQAVGGSADANGNGHAVLWENGVITDLNTLICHGGSSLYLEYAGDINDRGEIVGQAIDLNTGASPQFLAVPTDGGDDCEADPSGGQKVALPENVREQLRQRRGFGRIASGTMRQE